MAKDHIEMQRILNDNLVLTGSVLGQLSVLRRQILNEGRHHPSMRQLVNAIRVPHHNVDNDFNDPAIEKELNR